MPEHFAFKTYAWSLGTTSFRMADFHRKVEEQLILLDRFWREGDNGERTWAANTETQVRYYDFLFERKFTTGEIRDRPDKMAKSARQKTSGLVDIGLIDGERRLTPVGERLLSMAKSGDFRCDNPFQIPGDSFLYLKQMMKTVNAVEGGVVRPFLVTGKVLSACGGYLTDEEFTYLLPLCVSEETTGNIIEKIGLHRRSGKPLDEIIVETVLGRYSYPAALDYLIGSAKTPEDIMAAGMNRDGARHDACYARLYEELRRVYLEGDPGAVPGLLEAARGIGNKPGALWRKLLLSKVGKRRGACRLAPNRFDGVETEEAFDRCFFTYLHLHKIKATLSDYRDLNRRYLQITDAVLFDDGKVAFTPLFANFFKTDAGKVWEDAYRDCRLLAEDCPLERINASLVFDGGKVIGAFNAETGLSVDSMEGVYDYVENDRYRRFRRLIDTRFPNKVILKMLDQFESRERDAELIGLAGGQADVPTVFEYIVGVAWYRLSGYCGKILDYMRLSLDMNLLPRTHAGGGESDIVYQYARTPYYPKHTLLIECTLMEGTGQRHGEMEPVSRHLANYMIDEDENAYCAFVSNNLHASVLSDFRMRKSFPYYRNDREHVDGMKIIPLHTRELKRVLEKNISYAQLYGLFEDAHASPEGLPPPEWYARRIKAEIEAL